MGFVKVQAGSREVNIFQYTLAVIIAAVYLFFPLEGTLCELS